MYNPVLSFWVQNEEFVALIIYPKLKSVFNALLGEYAGF